MKHLPLVDLEAGLDEIRQSPRDAGVLTAIVRRPRIGERETLQECELDCVQGLVGDNWRARGYDRSSDGSAHPDMQVTVMNSRVIALVAQDQERGQLAGDQLYIDLDLSTENLPPGTRLALGSAVIEVTAAPHTGCGKFAARFGRDARAFVNSAAGKQLNLRGINAKVVQSGVVRVGELARKL